MKAAAARKKARAALLKAEEDGFEQKASDINAIRSSVSTEFGYFIGDDGSIRKVGGGTYKQADAQKAYDAFLKAANVYRNTEGDIVEALNIIPTLR